MDKHWLTFVIVLLIVVIVIDGIRRMLRARQDSIKMSLRPGAKTDDVLAGGVSSAQVMPGETNVGDTISRDTKTTEANLAASPRDKQPANRQGFDQALPTDPLPVARSAARKYGSEFPNGGARASEKKIDPARIQKARSKYNFGTDLPVWGEKVSEKLAEGFSAQSSNIDPEQRIEPSFDERSTYALDQASLTEAKTDTPYENNITMTTENDDDKAGSSLNAEKYTDKSLDTDDSTSETAKIPTSATAKASTSAEQKTVKKNQPVQTRLNLDEAVPMLMDTLSELDATVSNTLDDDDDVALAEPKIKSKTISASTDKTGTPKTIVSVGTPIESRENESTRTETYSANKPRYESKYVDHRQQHQSSPTDVLVIHLKAAKGEYFYGSDLLELILAYGLRFGGMDIFHRHADEDGEGPVMFSMANMVKPGTFDLHKFEDFSTVGLSFFLALPPASGNAMTAFDTMLETAQGMAEKMSGELNDEQRSILTKQTIAHYRERIRDFARKQQLEKNK